MKDEIQIATMSEIEEYDNQRDDWQDELRGEGFGVPTPEGIFLLGCTVVAVVFVILVAMAEVWRIVF